MSEEETLEPSESSLWQYVAVVDERTCEECLSHDGMIYSWEEVEQLFPNISPAGPDAYNVNMHPNCRCQLVKVAEGVEEEEKPVGFLFWTEEGVEAHGVEAERFTLPSETVYLSRAAVRATAGRGRPYYVLRRTALAGLRRVFAAAGLPFPAALLASMMVFTIAELIASYFAEEERRRREEEYRRERLEILAEVQKLFNELKAELNRDKEEERRKALKDVRELSRTLIPFT